MTLDDFQRAKLIEWAEWCLTHGAEHENMPCGIRMVDWWAFETSNWFDRVHPFPTREQFAERQNAVTSEAI